MLIASSPLQLMWDLAAGWGSHRIRTACSSHTLMLPSFRYLSETLFSRRRRDHERQLRSQRELQSPSGRVQPLVGELFAGAQTGTVENARINSFQHRGNDLPSGALGGFFPASTNFAVENSTMIDHLSIFMDSRPVLDALKAAGTPEAALDTGIRHPAPRCHPGSRRTIYAKLDQWLLDLNPQRKLTWLYGPAGVGKTAIAQTFGEHVSKCGRLGAAFFFSSLESRRSDVLRVIPTLSYQLAIRNADYKQVVTQQLASDPSVLDAALPIQFQKLIIEPFSRLIPPNTQQTVNKGPYLVIFDGVDECQDEDAQCELIELINDAAQRNDIPLIWLLCSRVEPHIQYTFSQLEYSLTCDREGLAIDDEARVDVEHFLRESFKSIYLRYRSVISTLGADGGWPPEGSFDIISKAASGYFVFASMVVKVVGDRTVGDPEGQLTSLMKILQGLANAGVSNPLEALDIFYSRILSRVPQSVLPTAIQILGICARGEPRSIYGVVSVDTFALFLRIQRGAFYGALEKLHSIVDVPPPKNAQAQRLSFFHESFSAYLRSPDRSGKFFLPDTRVHVLLKVGQLYWRNDLLVYRYPELVEPEEYYRSQSMLMRWSLGNGIGENILKDVEWWISQCGPRSMPSVQETDSEFFDVLCRFNFGFLPDNHNSVYDLLSYMHVWDWSKTPAGPHFIRTTEFDSVADAKLLHHLSILSNGKLIPPINTAPPGPTGNTGRLPLPWKVLQPNTVGYIIIGHGSKSGLACYYQKAIRLQVIFLNPFIPPTTAQISRCDEWFEEMG